MRMLHLFVGQDRFLQAVQLFLRRFAYQTATAIDFWTCVEEITNLPISKKTISKNKSLEIVFRTINS